MFEKLKRFGDISTSNLILKSNGLQNCFYLDSFNGVRKKFSFHFQCFAQGDAQIVLAGNFQGEPL